MPDTRPLTLGRFQPRALFQPRSVAVLGAGTPAGAQVMANLRAGGFKGAVLPIGAFDAVAGVLAYPDIASLPIAPDLAICCADGFDASDVFARLAQRGVFAAVVIGMAERVGEASAATGVRSLGPGSFGIAVPSIGLHATRSHLRPRAGRVALVSQSAALCRAVLDWAEPNGVGFSCVVGVGGNTDLGFARVLDWLSRDGGTGAILMDIRLIRDRRMFLSGARAASRLRPVVAMRAGGRLLDHTGRADAAFESALRRAGVLCVDRLEDLLAAAETLSRARPARGEGLAIVTNAIGPAQMAADAALRDGLRLAELSPETRDVMRLALPNAFAPSSATLAGTRTGDIVYVGTGEPIKLAEAAALLSGAREVGGVMIVHAPTGEADAAGMLAIAAAHQGMKAPLLVCVMGETTGAGHRRALAEAGVPVFATPEQAVRGFHHLVEDRRNRAAARELPPSDMLHLEPDRALVRDLLATLRTAGRLLLDEAEVLAVLGAYGIRSGSGGVPAIRIAVADDPTFGPTITIGPPGGQDPRDEAVDLPPLNLPLAHALIRRARLAPPSQTLEDDLADILVRISQLVVDMPELATISLDPLLQDVGRLQVAASRLELRPADAAPVRLALPPYPGELAGRFETNGESLVIRPIRPEDAKAHGALFARLSPQDIRYRFFSAMREMSPEQMARMTQVDYEREMAFVAVREGPGTSETVAVARLVCESADLGEFAIVVQPDMKGRGLARHLMTRLIDWGRAQGLSEIAGQVMADNLPMLAFVRRLGFSVRPLVGEADVVEAVMTL